MSQLVDDLKAVRELLSVPERWTKGADARDAHGKPVYPRHESAACWCLEGAIIRESSNWPELLDSVAILAYRSGRGIYAWNDATKRTHADVLALIDLAIAKAEGKP